MTGLEWQAYVLVKELVEKSVEIAWEIEVEVAKWTEDDLPVPGDDSGQYVCPARLSESGPLAITVSGTLSGPTQPVMVGQGKLMTGDRKTTKVGSRGKNKKLPGVSASQKSVKAYSVRKPTMPCVGPSGVCAISVVTDMSAKKNVSRPDMEKVPSILKSEKHI